MTESRENSVDPNLSAANDRAAPSNRIRRALIVGVEHDVERRLMGVAERSIAAKRDAEAVQSLLKAGFAEAKLLIDPDRQQFEEELYALAAAGQPNDLLLIYYSGQSFVDDEGKLFLAAANTRSNSLGELNKTTAIALSTLQTLLKDAAAQQVIVLDCSFSAQNALKLDFDAQLGAPNRVILSASRTTDYTTAYKLAALSLYTEFLQDAIETGCGLPPDAPVTTHHIHRYIQQRMQQAAPAVEPLIVPPHPEFAVAIAVAPPLDETLIYRAEVEARAQAGEISEFDRLILNWRRDQLGLSPDTASQIEAAALKPQQTYVQNCQRYRDTLEAIAQAHYPFRPATQMALAHCRQQLGLSADRAEAIATETLADREQYYGQQVQQYEQYLAEQIQSGAWLDRTQRNEFRYLEQQLHLLPRDLAIVWQRHTPTQVDAPPDSNPKQPSYAQRLQDYQQIFLDQVQPDRPLPAHMLAELDALQHTLQLRDEDVAIAEEVAVRQKRDRYEALLQRYQQELLLEDDSPGSRAQLQQMQRQLNEADVAIAAKIAALLNPMAEPEQPAAEPIAPIEPAAEAAAIESSPPETAAPKAAIQPAVLPLPNEARPTEPPQRRLPPRSDRLKPWERNTARRSAAIDSPAPIANSRSLGERLNDRSFPLRLLKAILFAIVAVVLGRFVIAQILRILPYPIDNIVGITLFGVVILFAWRQIDQLR